MNESTNTAVLHDQHRQAITRLTSGDSDPVEVEVINPDGTTQRRTLSVHPLARLIPLITPADLSRLSDDITVRGVNEPLVLFEGQVLDGRNRLAVAAVAGVPVPVREFPGDADAARAYVWSANAARRHLSTPQLALAASRFGFISDAKTQAGPEDRGGNGDGAARRGAPRWANLASRRIGGAVSPRTLERFEDARVAEAPETVRRIESGEIRRVDVAVKQAAAEHSVITGRPVQVPPPVPRTPWDRLGCARGDVLAAERSAISGDFGGMTVEQFANRAREIQGALIRIQQAYRYARAGR